MRRWHGFWNSHKRDFQTRENPPTTPSKEASPSDILRAEELKTEGNSLFRRGKYLAAAEVRPLVIWLYECDAVRNIQKPFACGQSGQAHYFLGLALEARNDHEAALIHLEKSYELARDKEDQIMDEIWRNIARVSYAQWEHEAVERQEQDNRLKTRLQSLLTEAQIREQRDAMDPSQLRDIHADEAAALERLFHRASAPDRPVEIPSCLTCVLSMDVFRDPVVSPSGFSYEYADLKKHLNQVGQFDPVTRQAINASQLIRNLNLRAVGRLYLKEHPWAWKESL